MESNWQAMSKWASFLYSGKVITLLTTGCLILHIGKRKEKKRKF